MIANMRMYGVNDDVLRLWKDLALWVSRRSGVSLDYVEHPPPKPISELWSRDDLGMVQMCGWPFHRADPQPSVIAAPIMDDDRTDDQPLYWSEMIVRNDNEALRIEDTFGGTIAWTIEDSHSGFNAPRHLLLPHFLSKGRNLYRKSVGPVVTPRGAIDAVLTGAADIAPVDGYFFKLIEKYEPQTLERIRSVGETEKAPIPLFVGAPSLDQSHLSDFRSALTSAHKDEYASSILSELCIRRFVVPEPALYSLAENWHQEAINRGYHTPS